MEVPDRLYLSHLIYETYQYQIPDPDDDTEIEYVRKDAFTEKVCDFIRINAEKHIYFDEGNSEWYDSEEFIEDFKNYMKGELL